MASSSPIARKKEGWLGVILTALGCGVFLAWWFWPSDGDSDSLSRSATPANLLQAAEEARTAKNGAALDAEIAILTLQAHAFGDDWLLQKAQQSVQDPALQELMNLYAQPEPAATLTEPEPDALETALEKDKVDAALALGAAMEGLDQSRAMLKIAAFHTQMGDLDRAKELVEQYMRGVPEDAVDLQLNMARLHGQWGEFEKAEATVKMVAAKAGTTDQMLAVAEQCYLLNLFDEGRRLMAQAEQSAGKDEALAKQVIEFYLTMGETVMARNFSERVTSSGLLALELALAGWEPDAFAEALQAWRTLKTDTAKSQAVSAIREYIQRQVSAANVPALFATPVASAAAIDDAALTALQEAVDSAQPELAAAAVAKWEPAEHRSLGYVILSRLMLWRHARASGGAL
ncbi:MAG: hypothetical protein ACI9R3_004835 [Verrucomicrobiales bacterium]|jgi:hypothetical protein